MHRPKHFRARSALQNRSRRPNQGGGTRTHASQGLELGDLAAKSKRNADAFFDAADVACKPEPAGFKRAAPVKAPPKSKVAKIDTTGMKSIASFFGKK